MSLLDVWVFIRYSSFFSLCKNLHDKLTGDSKLTFAVSMHGCMSVQPCDGLAIYPGCIPPFASLTAPAVTLNRMKRLWKIEGVANDAAAAKNKALDLLS